MMKRFYSDESIDKIVKQEENRIYAYISGDKPFNYLPYMNQVYFNNSYRLMPSGKAWNLIDFTLDMSHYLKRNGVLHDNTFYSLKGSLSACLKSFMVSEESNSDEEY